VDSITIIWRLWRIKGIWPETADKYWLEKRIYSMLSLWCDI